MAFDEFGPFGHTYTSNRRWSDRYLPAAKRIIAEHILTEAPDALDMREATDLMMLDASTRRIAVRVRRPGYANRYPYDITIRSGLPSGAETELSKIVNGHGDWMLYGHACADGIGLDRWWLLDLRAFRAALIRRQGICSGERVNHDGTRFRWFDVRSFPAEPQFVLAGSSQAPSENRPHLRKIFDH